MKPIFFANGADFRDWLDAHHDGATELIVGFYKKAARRDGITYRQALDAALAYGWIDGVRRRMDAARWTIRFTPRRAGSIWSRVNVARVNELIAAQGMAPAGLRAFEARQASRGGVYSYEQRATALEPRLAARLAANARAKRFFDAQPPGYRRVLTHWVMSAKKDETRSKRLAQVIDSSARRERIDFMKPRS